MSTKSETKLRSLILITMMVFSAFAPMAIISGTATAANGSIDVAGNTYDERLDSGGEFWAGQDLVFEAGNVPADANQDYQLREADDTQNGSEVGSSETTIGLDENAEGVLNTTGLSGEYVLVDTGDNARTINDGIVGNIVETEQQIDQAVFNVTQHDLNVSAARTSVLTGETITFLSETNRDESYTVNISASGLNNSELVRIFGGETGPTSVVGNGTRVNGPDSIVEYPSTDTVAIESAPSDRAVNASFGSYFDTLAPVNYTFNYSVQDSTATDTVDVEVRESPRLDGSGVNPATLTTDRVTFSVRHQDGQYDQVHSFPSDGTATIIAGTINNSNSGYANHLPVPNTSVEVEIRRPDGQVETRSVTTNENGSARIQYDLAGKPEGRYNIEAASRNSYADDFRVGNVTKIVPQGERLIVGRETSFAVHVTENGRPIDASRTVRIEAANGSTITETVQTGSDGFAEFTYTPQENGYVRVTTETRNTDALYAQAGTASADLTFQSSYGDSYLEVPGEGRAAIGASIVSGGEPLSNSQVIVQIRNDSNNNAVVETLTVDTNQNGQFVTTWDVPDAPEFTSYSVALYDGSVSDANAVSTPFNTITISNDVASPSSGGGGGGGGTVNPQPDIVVNEWSYDEPAPGGTKNFTVSVDDSNGEPVGSQEIFYTLYLTNDVPVKSGYVTTNDTGLATIREQIPDDATLGDNVRLHAYTTVNGTQITSNHYIGELRRYLVDSTLTDSNGTPYLQPGEEVTFEVYLDHAQNGTDVTDFPVSSAMTVSGASVGMATLNATVERTNDNGVATFSAQVPNDATGRVRIESWALPGARDDIYFQGGEEIRNFTTDLENLDGSYFYPDEVEAGTELNFTIRADDPPATDRPVTAIVTVGTDDDYQTNESRIGPNTVLYADVVSLGQGTTRNVSFQIPSTIVDDQQYYLNVDATTPNGPLTNEESRSFTVNSSRTPDNARPVPDVSVANQVAVNNSFIVDASDSVDDTGIVNYTVQTGTGETVTSASPVIEVPGFDSTGTYDVTLYVTDSVGKTESVTTQVEVVEAADLVGELSAPAETRLDDGLVVNYTVSNDGVDSANGDVSVNLTAVGAQGTTFSDETILNGITAGTQRTLSTNLTSFIQSNDVTGPVELSLTVTSPSNLTEATTTNNNDTASTQVRYADLNTSVYVSDDTFQNANVTVYGFIENRGTATSSGGTATFTVNGSTIQYDLPALEPGAVNRTSQTLTVTGDTSASLSVTGDAFPAGNETTQAITATSFSLSDLNVNTRETVEEGDTFWLTTSFDANAETDVTAELDLPDGLSAGQFDDVTKTEHIYDGRNWVSWEISADEVRQTPYEINVTVRGGGESVTDTRNVTVTVPTTRVQDSEQMVLNNDSESDTGTIEVPNATTTEHTFTVDVSSGTTGRSLEGLDYLVRYPYGCVEQTTSPMLSGLYVDQYYRNGSIAYDEQTVDGTVEQGISRLNPDGAIGQHDTGAWSMYGNHPSGDMFYTIYAMFGTSSVATDPIQGDRSAIDSEIQNGPDTINYSAAVSWLSDQQNGDGSFRAGHYLDDRQSVTGFTLVGLEKAEAAGLNDSASQDLATTRENAAGYLLSEQQADGSWGSAQSTALAVWGLQTAIDANNANIDDAAAQAAIDNGTRWLIDNQQDDGGWEQYHQSYAFDSTGDRSEATAYALLALNATGIENTNTTITAGANYLTGIYQEDGSWGYTRATALSIRALRVTGLDGSTSRTVDLTIGADSLESAITETVSVTGDSPAEITLTESELQRLRDASDGATRTVEAELGSSGDGRVYVSFDNDQIVHEEEYNNAP